MLPSHVMETGSTFDLEVLNISTRYEVYAREQAKDQNKVVEGNAPPPMKELSQEQLQELHRSAKQRQREANAKS